MQNYFDIFQHPVTYFVDKSALRRKYLAKIKEYQNSDNQEQLTLLHKAYKTLNDDELRMGYLLELWGIIHETGNSDTKLSNEFLMEMMELNEAIESGDQKAKEQVQELLNKNLEFIENLFRQEIHEENKLYIFFFYFERKYLRRLIAQV